MPYLIMVKPWKFLLTFCARKWSVRETGCSIESWCSYTLHAVPAFINEKKNAIEGFFLLKSCLFPMLINVKENLVIYWFSWLILKSIMVCCCLQLKCFFLWNNQNEMFTTKESSHKKVEYKILVILCLVVIYLRGSFSKRKAIFNPLQQYFFVKLNMENTHFWNASPLK